MAKLVAFSSIGFDLAASTGAAHVTQDCLVTLSRSSFTDIMKTIASLAFLSSAATVAGHATFQQLWVNGEDMESSCIRMPKNNSPVTDVSSNDIRCNAAPSAAAGICEAKGKFLAPLTLGPARC